MATGALQSPRPLSVTIALLVCACCCIEQTIGQQSNGNNNNNQQASQLLEQNPINLAAILQHQEALAAECQSYKLAKERELEYLLQFNADNEQVHLPEPMPIKVPAVCLLFLAAELDERLASLAGVEQQQSATKPKLEMVNWIFNEDDIQARGSLLNSTAKLVKRASVSNSAALSNYLLDPEVGALGSGPPNEAQGKQVAQFHKEIDALMADERYQSGIKQASNMLASHLSPVILIPGLLGSRLQAKTHKTTRVNVFCGKNSDWQDIWLSIRMFLPIAVDCWLDNARLELDPISGYTRQPAGVEARVADFGSVESVRHLDLNQPKLTTYFQPLIERYEQLGYTADVNLLAAPYDFRLAPPQMSAFFKDLRSLVEQAQYNSPSGKKVTLVCHSMGCTHALVFLRQQSSAWRQRHIRKLIALSSPWAGTIKALKALVVGDTLDLPLVSETKIRKLARTFPSISYLLPQAEVFNLPTASQLAGGGPTVVQAPGRSYKVADMEQLMNELGLQVQYKWFKESASLIKPLEPLADLNVDCIHSLNVPTAETLIFRNETDLPDGDYELVNGDGDGTVNLQSLSVCDIWAQRLPDKVKQTVILNTDHKGVISHKVTLTHLTDDVMMN